MYYVIQENLFREYHFNTLMDVMKRYKLEFETVRYTPFVKQVHVENPNNYKNVWFFGSVNAAMVLTHTDWYPGILYNEKHDFEYYFDEYKSNLLNYGAAVKPVERIDRRPHWEYFIRPTRDTKIFESKVYRVDEWNQYIEELEKSGELENVRKDTKMLYTSPKPDIQQEIRCWIVDGEPVTMSQYKIGKRVNMLNMDHNEEAYIFSKKMAKIFSPSRAFVLDICLYNDDYKIVEINCINMSGFYDANMSKLIQSLENAFNGTETRESPTGDR